MTGTEPQPGVLRVDKPEGPTSHDIVAAARRALHTRRIGHTGTLDPFASGLLLLCVGTATRLAEYLSCLGKSYRATIRLGAATDTDDATGTSIATSETWMDVDVAQLRQELARMEGMISQTPPVYSAKKIGGERAYRMARRGVAVKPEPVDVEIRRLELIAFAAPDAVVDVDCSSGTYVRAIARDLGQSLGTHAHLARLRRTRIGRCVLDGAVQPAMLDDPVAVARAWLTPLAALDHLPAVAVDPTAATRLEHGGAIETPAGAPNRGMVTVAIDGALLAVAEVVDGWLWPRKVFPRG